MTVSVIVLIQRCDLIIILIFVIFIIDVTKLNAIGHRLGSTRSNARVGKDSGNSKSSDLKVQYAY